VVLLCGYMVTVVTFWQTFQRQTNIDSRRNQYGYEEKVI